MPQRRYRRLDLAFIWVFLKKLERKKIMLIETNTKNCSKK